jgi:prophage regulatory protein
MEIRLLAMNEVIRRVNLSRSTIYRKMKLGTFPAPLDLSENRIAWPESDIDAWLMTRKRRGTVVRLPPEEGAARGLVRASAS